VQLDVNKAGALRILEIDFSANLVNSPFPEIWPSFIDFSI
jgi:hypothetical protein